MSRVYLGIPLWTRRGPELFSRVARKFVLDTYTSFTGPMMANESCDLHANPRCLLFPCPLFTHGFQTGLLYPVRDQCQSRHAPTPLHSASVCPLILIPPTSHDWRAFRHLHNVDPHTGRPPPVLDDSHWALPTSARAPTSVFPAVKMIPQPSRMIPQPSRTIPRPS
jgi:hypothetical protein